MTATLFTLICVLGASPQMFSLQTPLPAHDFVAEDVNQDGVADLFVLCAEAEAAEPTRALAAFISQDGRYPAEPTFVIDLPAETGVLFWAEMDGAPPRELIAADSDGATVYAYRDGRMKAVERVAFSSILPRAMRRPVFLKELAADLDGDGRDEWLIPTTKGVEIRKGAEALALVEADFRSAVERNDGVRIVHRLPQMKPMTVPGSPVKALAMLSGDQVEFAHGETWGERARFTIPMRDRDTWRTRVGMEDINGNGLPDFLLTQSQGTVNIEMATEVFLAEGPFQYSQTPSAAFTAKNMLTSPAMIDVNGDGKLDLVNIRTPFSVRTIVNFLLRRRLSLSIDVHLYNEEAGGFTERPQYETRLTIEALEDYEQLAYAMGDMTGNGWIDAAFGASESQVVVHTGSEDTLLSRNPSYVFDVPGQGRAQVIDLDGSPGKDLVLLHPGTRHSRRVHVILF